MPDFIIVKSEAIRKATKHAALCFHENPMLAAKLVTAAQAVDGPYPILSILVDNGKYTVSGFLSYSDPETRMPRGEKAVMLEEIAPACHDFLFPTEAETLTVELRDLSAGWHGGYLVPAEVIAMARDSLDKAGLTPEAVFMGQRLAVYMVKDHPATPEYPVLFGISDSLASGRFSIFRAGVKPEEETCDFFRRLNLAPEKISALAEQSEAVMTKMRNFDGPFSYRLMTVFNLADLVNVPNAPSILRNVLGADADITPSEAAGLLLRPLMRPAGCGSIRCSGLPVTRRPRRLILHSLRPDRETRMSIVETCLKRGFLFTAGLVYQSMRQERQREATMGDMSEMDAAQREGGGEMAVVTTDMLAEMAGHAGGSDEGCAITPRPPAAPVVLERNEPPSTSSSDGGERRAEASARCPVLVSEGEDAAILRAALLKVGGYRVLREIRVATVTPDEVGFLKNPDVAQAGAIDCEATSTMPKSAELLSFSLTPFWYSRASGEIIGVGETHDWFRQPKKAIPEEITALTGITNAMVEGKSLPIEEIQAVVQSCGILIAHNAGYDRVLATRFLPFLSKSHWACTLRQIDWTETADKAELGKTLSSLIAVRGYYHQAHSGNADTNALTALLAHNGSEALKILLAKARETTVVLHFQTAWVKNEEQRDAIKRELAEIGFQWAAPGWRAEVPIADMLSTIQKYARANEQGMTAPLYGQTSIMENSSKTRFDPTLGTAIPYSQLREILEAAGIMSVAPVSGSPAASGAGGASGTQTAGWRRPESQTNRRNRPAQSSVS